jgi:sec-independent protein translocase protein TatC
MSNEEKEMSFLDHLEELRWRILKSVISVFIFTIGSYSFSEEMLNFLTNPYKGKLIYISPAGAFIIRIKISILVGIIASSPVIFYQLWRFVSPGLYTNEKKYFLLIVFISVFCFLLGAGFAFFFVLPAMLDFFSTFQTEKLEAYVSIDEYFSLLINFILALGAVFELPVLSFFLTKLNLITADFLRLKRKYAIVIIFILAAIITPSPDIISQLMIAVPLLILYEVSIIVSALALKKIKIE